MIVYTKDVQRIIGKSAPTARNLMDEIREKLGKESHHVITLRELCEHIGLSEEEGLNLLGGRKQ